MNSTIEALSYKTCVEYSTDNDQIKRIATLNSEQFACTAQGKNKNRVLFFKVNDDLPELEVDVSEMPYSLIVINDHLLIGHSDGFMTFLRGPSFDEPEITNRLHKGLIFDIVPHIKKEYSQNIITISSDFSLKLWNIC